MRLKQQTKITRKPCETSPGPSGTCLEMVWNQRGASNKKTQQGVCFVGTLPGREGWDDDGEDGREKKLWEAGGTDVFQGGRLEGWWRGCS
jgi:hypothetical protein